MLHTENNIIFYKNHCWRVIAIVKEKEGVNIGMLRVKYQADLVLRRGSNLYLCEHVPEAEIIEEINFKDEN